MPDYYKHQQAIFLAFWKKGLVYRKKQKVNWDPVDNTVLANEQVVDGKGWRSGAPVETRELEQWMFRVTAYADDLLARSSKLDKWPDKVRLMQANWIGKSQGARFKLDIVDREAGRRRAASDPIEVFTTRPDTLFGASFVALAPDHPLTKASRDRERRRREVHRRRAQHLGTSEADIEKAEKFGVDLGLRVKHPFDPSWELPVWAANFVLSTYGTGAHLRLARGRPARPRVRQQVQACPSSRWCCRRARMRRRTRSPTRPFTGDGTTYNSKFLDGLPTREAIARAIEELVKLGAGEATTQWRLRDWGVSRQRYWGCPIPAIHCAKCGVVPVPEKDLPVALPDDVTFDEARQSAGASPDVEAHDVPDMRRQGEARNRHARYVRGFELVFRALHRSEQRRRAVRQEAGRATGCRSINMSAASSTPCCTCSTRASSRRGLRDCGYARWPRRTASRSPACSRKAWWCTRRTSPRPAQWLLPEETEIKDGKRIELADGQAG